MFLMSQLLSVNDKYSQLHLDEAHLTFYKLRILAWERQMNRENQGTIKDSAFHLLPSF